MSVQLDKEPVPPIVPAADIDILHTVPARLPVLTRILDDRVCDLMFKAGRTIGLGVDAD